MSDDRPFLEIPLPSIEEQIRFEEWIKKKKQDDEEEQDRGHIIIIDI